MDRILNQTSSLCSKCKKTVPATLVENDGRIVMRKTCAEHGLFSVLISSDAAWYHRTLDAFPAVLAKPEAKKKVTQGCPYDCGSCGSHQQKTYLPVVPITSSCNLDCPICYTHNKNEGAFHLGAHDFREILARIRSWDEDMKVLNITGGEPTLHPNFLDLIRIAKAEGVNRITISTHGLTFLKNEAMLAELAELDARVVLSFNSFNGQTWEKMIGSNVLRAKLRVLDLLEKHNVDTTLIPVLALGCNDDEIGKLVELLLEKPFLRSLELHSMTFTGQGGRGFDPAARLTVPDVLRLIETATAGRVALSDFVPSPCAHPLCYQTCYLFDTGEEFVPFARFMDVRQLRRLMEDNLYIEPGARTETILQEVMTELWAKDELTPVDERILASLKELIAQVYPAKPKPYAERQKISERSAKTIYLHSHMDEDNFDTDRIRQCCVTVPEPDGSTIPTCSYNILYRERDARFSTHVPAPMTSLGSGRMFPS